MTPEEARRVAAAAKTADEECVVCAARVLSQLAAAFPEVDWLRAAADKERDANEWRAAIEEYA